MLKTKYIRLEKLSDRLKSNFGERTVFYKAAFIHLILYASFLFIFYPALSSGRYALVQSVSTKMLANSQKIKIRCLREPVYTWFTLTHPERLIIDIEDTSHPIRFSLAEDGIVKAIHQDTKNTGTVRITADLHVKTNPSFQLLYLEGYYYIEVRLHRYSPPQNSVTDKITMAKPIRDAVVVIDSGHGGKDPGAISTQQFMEKHITLAIAKKMAVLLNNRQGIRAYLTRHDDSFISLRDRTKIARKHKADIFISLHANSMTGKNRQGAMVFILSPHGAVSEIGRWLEKKENSEMLIGGINGIDLNEQSGELAAVLLDLLTENTMVHSFNLAHAIIHQFKLSQIRMYSEKVEKAEFIVLKSPDIPSVLVETGFISTLSEAKLLASDAYQCQLAEQLTQAVMHYFTKHPPAGSWIAQQSL